jgi:O-methyltransferase
MNQDEFVKKSTESGVDTAQSRKSLVDHFSAIQNSIECLHEISDSFYIADYILRNQNISGDFLEFGCYRGGMSAKIAKVAQVAKKKYFIFDTFSGLPNDANYATYNPDWEKLGLFTKNQFACPLENVKANLERFGVAEHCELISGLIEETLPRFLEDKIEVLSCFIDVDIYETAQFIIKNLWNKIRGHGIFTHEACLVDYMDNVMSSSWWLRELEVDVPILASSRNKPDPKKQSSGLKNCGCLDFLMKESNYNF